MPFRRVLNYIAVFSVVVAFGLVTTLTWAQTIPTPASTCTNQTGISSFWEQSGICVSGVWQRPAFQFGASSSQTCNSGLAGMLQWTGTAATPNSALEYCNGSAWIPVGLLGTAASTTSPYRTGEVGTGLFSNTASTIQIATGATERLRVTATGSIGIGTSTPTVMLDVNGAIYGHVYNAGSSTTIDWSQGNVQYTTASCGSFTFSNMQDGGSYTLAVEGSTSGTCAFTHSGLTFKMPTSHGASTVSTMTLYSFFRAGTYVFVTWQPGY